MVRWTSLFRHRRNPAILDLQEAWHFNLQSDAESLGTGFGQAVGDQAPRLIDTSTGQLSFGAEPVQLGVR